MQHVRPLARCAVSCQAVLHGCIPSTCATGLLTCLQGLPAIAVSLDDTRARDEAAFQPAARVTAALVKVTSQRRLCTCALFTLFWLSNVLGALVIAEVFRFLGVKSNIVQVLLSILSSFAQRKTEHKLHIVYAKQAARVL